MIVFQQPILQSFKAFGLSRLGPGRRFRFGLLLLFRFGWPVRLVTRLKMTVKLLGGCGAERITFPATFQAKTRFGVWSSPTILRLCRSNFVDKHHRFPDFRVLDSFWVKHSIRKFPWNFKFLQHRKLSLVKGGVLLRLLLGSHAVRFFSISLGSVAILFSCHGCDELLFCSFRTHEDDFMFGFDCVRTNVDCVQR